MNQSVQPKETKEPSSKIIQLNLFSLPFSKLILFEFHLGSSAGKDLGFPSFWGQGLRKNTYTLGLLIDLLADLSILEADNKSLWTPHWVRSLPATCQRSSLKLGRSCHPQHSQLNCQSTRSPEKGLTLLQALLSFPQTLGIRLLEVGVFEFAIFKKNSPKLLCYCC